MILPLMLHLLQANAATPLAWAANYIHVIAWPTVCYAAIKMTNHITKARARLEKAFVQLDLLSTNHFPHMEESLKEIATILRERKTV